MTTINVSAHRDSHPALLVRLIGGVFVCAKATGGLLLRALIAGALALPAAHTVAHAAGITVAEHETAISVTEALHWPVSTRRNATHPLGLQTLSVEIQEHKHNVSDRRVRVYQFNYDDPGTRMLVVDVLESRLVSEHSIASVHLPLNASEVRFASTLLSQRADIVEQMKAEQRQRGRSVFTSLDELDVKASIFEPIDMDHPCAVQRCALLSLFDDTRTVFSIEPVINLQSLDVLLLGTY